MCTPRPPSRSISPCSTSTVARASERARWLGVVVDRNTRANEESLQLGASSRVMTRRASLAVSTTSNPGQARPCCVVEVLEEADVERRVVGDQDGAGRELEERRQRGLDRRGVGDHGVADAGEHRDERRDLGARVDQGLELAEHLATAHLDRTDLGDHAARLGRAAGRLEVDDGEGEVPQRTAQLVEAALRLPAGGASWTVVLTRATVGAFADTPVDHKGVSAPPGHQTRPGPRSQAGGRE